MKLSDSIYAQARITPIREDNQIKTVTRNADGSMDIEFRSGKKGHLSAGDEMLQAFSVYTMLNPDCNK